MHVGLVDRWMRWRMYCQTIQGPEPHLSAWTSGILRELVMTAKCRCVEFPCVEGDLSYQSDTRMLHSKSSFGRLVGFLSKWSTLRTVSNLFIVVAEYYFQDCIISSFRLICLACTQCKTFCLSEAFRTASTKCYDSVLPAVSLTSSVRSWESGTGMSARVDRKFGL